MQFSLPLAEQRFTKTIYLGAVYTKKNFSTKPMNPTSYVVYDFSCVFVVVKK